MNIRVHVAKDTLTPDIRSRLKKAENAEPALRAAWMNRRIVTNRWRMFRPPMRAPSGFCMCCGPSEWRWPTRRIPGAIERRAEVCAYNSVNNESGGSRDLGTWAFQSSRLE